MRSFTILHRSVAATMAMVLIAGLPASAMAAAPKSKRPAAAKGRTVAKVAPLPVGTQRPTSEVVLSTGRGQLVTLPTGVSDVWTSNDVVADVYVSSPRQIYLFGKAPGEATVFATSASGQVVYATNVRIGTNASSLDRMLKLAMPDAAITATTMNGLVLLTGTVAAPADSEEAERLTKAFLGEGINVVSRLRTATPLQVNLRVQIAEVSRSLSKSIDSNLQTRDTTGGFRLNVAQGRNFGNFQNFDYSAYPTRDFSQQFGFPAGTLRALPYNPADPSTALNPLSGSQFNLTNLGAGAGKTSIGLIGQLFGIDVGAALDLAETNGLVTLLAEPSLTALSGETASFLAGGEFPIPISQMQGQVSVEFKRYGVSLAFTPTVLADGRISMRVMPEVSQLSTEGAVTLNGFSIPAITTRRTETTVELGSGQSFMIGGLMQNNNANSITKSPGLGDVPVLGALFRSNGYRRSQTELMIIVTPYLVKPVSAGDIVLPTDGMKNPTDLQNFLLGQDFSGKTGGTRPKPTLGQPVTVPAPSVGGSPPPPPRAPTAAGPKPAKRAAGTAAPGFSN